jgi:prolipoprotein diacylglyceryltransferase
MGYAWGRFIIEQFRDDARGAAFLNFSISSWISLVLFVLAFVLFQRGGRASGESA